MAYEKTIWEDSPSTSTPLKAELLNHLEDGLASTNNAVDVSETNPTLYTSYYPTFVSATGVTKQRTNDGLRYDTQQGTSSTNGRATLVLGNGTPSGTAGNKQGRLALCNASSGFTWLESVASSSAFVQTLPALTGTVVVKQSANITTETNGWYKVNMGAYTMYFKTGQIPSQTYNMNGWGNLSGSWRNLPSGVTFDSTKMVFSGNAQCQDPAILYNLAIGNGGTAVGICYNNKYGSDLTGVGYYNFMLIDFS